MRDIIITRIEQIKASNDNFSKKIFRWKNIYIGSNHISDISFTTLSDIDLLCSYECVVRQQSKCM